MLMWTEKKYFCVMKNKTGIHGVFDHALIFIDADYLSFFICSLLEKLMEMSFLLLGATLYSNVAYYANSLFMTILFKGIFGGMLEDAEV